MRASHSHVEQLTLTSGPQHLRVDFAIAISLATAAAAASWIGSGLLAETLTKLQFGDVWFNADCARVVNDMTRLDSSHYRTEVHPLFVLLTYPLTWLMRLVTGASNIQAARALIACVAALCTVEFYAILRVANRSRPDAALFTLLIASSASTVFWFTVPETYALGMLTLAAVLLLVVIGERRIISPLGDVLTTVAALGVTVSNGWASICAMFVRHRPRTALLFLFIAISLMLVLMVVQQQFFTTAALRPIPAADWQYVRHLNVSDALSVVVVFLFHAVVMPAFTIVDASSAAMSVQSVLPGSGGPWTAIATALWAALLIVGGRELFQNTRRPVHRVLFLTLAGQLALHLAYGPETFLYACHFGPLLVLATVISTRDKQQRLVRTLALLLLIVGGTNNLSRFRQAVALIQDRHRNLPPPAARVYDEQMEPANNDCTILGIETSCDETSAAVVIDGRDVRSNIVRSQVELHARYGGVVPEIAARAHIESIAPIVETALERAETSYEKIDAIAITDGPGLVGSLLIGVTAAKTIALAHEKPLVAVDHIEAHCTSAALATDKPLWPAIALVVSGGHSSIYHVRGFLEVELLGQTVDDAAGEAFDKVAAILELGYPGGPHIQRVAQTGNEKAIRFPRAWLDKPHFDFSFSGLKTAVLYHVHGSGKKYGSLDHLNDAQIADIAASFQAALVEPLVRKTIAAAKKTDVHNIVVGGGVAANTALRTAMQSACKAADLNLFLTPMDYCTDNAAMIAALGYHRLRAGLTADLTLEPRAGLRRPSRNKSKARST